MNLLLIMNLWVFLCSLIGFIYGARRFFKPKKPVFLQLITCAVACLMYARLFPVIFILVQGEMNPGFNIGMLGLAGSLMFIMSGNYGQMDSLVDDGTKKFLLTRIMALVAPLIVIGIYVFIFMEIDMMSVRLGIGIVTIFMVPCVYYCFKHVIIFDVNLGLIRPLRMYNVTSLVYALAIMAEFYGEYEDVTPLFIAAMAVQGITALLLVPTAKRGVEKWTI